MVAPKRVQTISFLIMLLIVLIIVLLIIKPFFSLLALSFILAILFGPIHRWILNRINMPTISALLTILIMIIIVALPFWLFGQIAFNEAGQLYNQIKSGQLVINRDQIVSSVPAPLQTSAENFLLGLNNIASQFTQHAFSSISGIISNIADFLIAVTMLLFLMFFLLRDGSKIKQIFMDISPIATNQEQALFDRIVSAVNGVVKGQFLVALCQGAMATIGFFVFGVPQPLLWGLFTVLTALVPVVGTSLSVVPAIIFLFITGHNPQAIGLLVWEIAGVGMIDNLLGPRLVGGSLKLHPALVLLSVVGGLKFFGILGFLIGPIIMAVFVELVDMYRTDFKEFLNR